MSNSTFSESCITTIGTATSTLQPIYELWILRLLVNGGAWPYIDIEDDDFDFPTEGLLAPAAKLVEHYRQLSDKAEAAANKMNPSDRPKTPGPAIGDKLSYFRACGVTGPDTTTKIPTKLREALSAAEAWFKDHAGFIEPVAGNLKRIKKLFDLSDEAALALIFLSTPIPISPPLPKAFVITRPPVSAFTAYRAPENPPTPRGWPKHSGNRSSKRRRPTFWIATWAAPKPSSPRPLRKLPKRTPPFSLMKPTHFCRTEAEANTAEKRRR